MTSRTCPQTTRVGFRLLAGLVAATLLGGCSGGVRLPGTDRNQRQGAAAAADALAAALSQGDISTLPIAGASSTEANREFKQEATDAGGKLTARATAVDVHHTSASVTLAMNWSFPGVAQPWTYDSTATLTNSNGTWQTNWVPSVVHPTLVGSARLASARSQGRRGDIIGAGGSKLMTERPVLRIGLDKSQVDPGQQSAAAGELADLVGLDTKRFADAVRKAGDRAFVTAIVFRADASDRPSPARLRRIPGAGAIKDTAVLAPTHDFARPLLGTVGPASKDVIDASDGAIAGGDQVGLSGLERRYDVQLRGTPGVSVRITNNASATPTGAGSSPAAMSPTAPESSPASGSQLQNAPLFQVRPTDGTPLTVTLDQHMQSTAEHVLADVKPPSAIVALRPSTGEVLAAASGPGSGGQSVATVGQYAPGSTFKVASSLALLRAGLTPDTTVRCTPTVTVNGRTYKNYNDYPSADLGTIPLRTALAQSCNTAFISSRTSLSGDDLAQAAASLGLGNDYDVGFPAYFGAVPTPHTPTGEAEAMIGQGRILASPLVMAAVAASVSAGRTVVPRLLQSPPPKPSAAPLTGTEADQLRNLMGAVVQQGPGRFLQTLQPPPVIAKTGTAEYGTTNPPRTRAWMIAAQGDLAVAVFVADGDTGSKTAGPLLRRFLRQAGS